MPAQRSPLRFVADAVLTLAAAGGVVCIVLVIAALAFDVTLIMFRTGSMSPTIPAGSLAVVQQVPATSVEVGDVVTVERPGQLPVTHRITSVQASGQQSTITMRGDANDTDDPEPYTVSTVRRVLWSMPGLARVVQWFGNPYVLGGITVAASLLVTWAFWPRDGAGGDHGRRGGGAGRGPVTPAAPKRALGGPRRALRTVSVVAVSVALACSVTPARAADREVISGEHLTLISISDASMTSLRPGSWATWIVGITADAPDPGTIKVSLSGTGSSEIALDARVTSCVEAWQSGTCPGTSAELRRTAAFTLDGREESLTSFPAEQDRWLLIKVRLAEGVDSGRATLVVHARGVGDDLATDGDPLLPSTGSPIGWGVIGLGIVAVVVGIAVAGLGRRR